MHPRASAHHSEHFQSEAETQPKRLQTEDGETPNDAKEVLGSPSSQQVDSSPPNQESGDPHQSTSLSSPLDKLESSGDLKFKKKDYQRSRTLLFQSVLSSASLKSLKHQYTTPKPALERNMSNLLQQNIKNFQSYIQAPVLLLVTNPRPDDNIVIGQRLPFDQTSDIKADNLNTRSRARDGSVTNTSNGGSDTRGSSRRGNSAQGGNLDDDMYKEETILQQQKLTLNALKKLSLLLAPIIRTDEDDEDNTSNHRQNLRQISSKPLNSPRSSTPALPETAAPNSGYLALDRGQVPTEVATSISLTQNIKGSKLYLPAEVDLSQFSSLTRQSRANIAPVRNPHPSSPALPKAESEIILKDEKDESLTSPVVPPSETRRVDVIFNDPSAPFQVQPQTGALRQHQEQHVDRPDLKLNLSSLSRPQEPEHNQTDNTNALNRHKTGYSAGNIRTHNPLTELYVGRTNVSMEMQSPMHAPSVKSRALPLKKLQQINGFRSPMYIPAVLRKTIDTATDDDETGMKAPEDAYNPANDGRMLNGMAYHNLHTSSSTPILVTTSASSPALVRSTNLGHSHKGNGIDVSESHNLIHDLHGSHPYTNSHHVTSAIHLGPLHNQNNFLTSNRVQYHLHIVNAPPTRHHWLKDESVIECGIPGCRKKFNFFERRHHCRKCGGIFCKEHTLHYLYINHLAQFTMGGRGTLSRVCSKCINDYREFARQEFGAYNQDNFKKGSMSGNGSSSITVGAHGHIQTRTPGDGVSNGDFRHAIFSNVSNAGEENPKETVVGSVPANWSWSSF